MHLSTAALMTMLMHQPGTAVLNVGGLNIPSAAISDLSNPLADIIEHRGAARTIQDLLPLLETLSDFYLPGSGTVESVVIYGIARARPPTKQEQQRMWDRAEGIH